MKAIKRYFQKSLPVRLTLIFIIISAVITVLVVSSIARGLSSQWRHNITPHVFQYLVYVNNDIGNPPDISKATELSQQLGINIYIDGPDIRYSSTGIPLDLKSVEFHRKHRRVLLSNKHRISFGEHERHDRAILRSQIDDYSVYYELPRSDFDRPDIIITTMFWLLVVIIGSYLLLRYMLKPIQDITGGVKKMGEGQLDYRLPVRANNDLGELSDSINHMAEDIEHMLDAKRQLLLALSHELRSPLTRAKIATQMLETSNNRERIQADLDEMESLITEILEAERINTPHSTLNKTDVEIEALIHFVLSEMMAPPIEVDIPADLPRVAVDETRIRLLVRNLVSNALRHSEVESPPKIKIQLESDSIIIKVIDQGPGIPNEAIKKVTEPFYRLDPSRTRSTGGFGIGLYLCKLIVEAHGGVLSIDSEVNKGTTVQITLPV